MSILRTLNTGASGLKAHADALGVVGDNIANVNTIGFKKSQATFEDVLGRAVSGSSATPQAGAGVHVSDIRQTWGQGSLLTTDSSTDLALSGSGFFVVNGNVGGVSGNYYTRAGQFTLNPDGFLVNPAGMKLQGYNIQDDGSLGGTMEDLQISGGTIAATPTANATIYTNFDANEVVPAAFDPLDPDATSNFSTSLTTYDSLGNQHQLTIYFRKSGANAWEWFALVDGGETTTGTAGVPEQGANGTLTFTTDGELDTETTAASSWDFLDATQAQVIDFDFGTSITTDGGTGLDGTTQFGSPFTISALSQDGFSAGSVAGLSFESDGTVTGVFSNGQRRTLAQLAIADFANVDGLERAGQGLWTSSQESGAALIGTAETGGNGSIVANALEQSNVDLGREFVDLIAYQRGFQANSRVIQTADEMYSELVNLKR